MVVLDADLTDDEATALAGAERVVHLATVMDPRLRTVDAVLPITTMAEEQGVYVNRDRRAQRYLPARTPPGMARPAWWVASQAWSLVAAGRSAPATAAEAFTMLMPFDGLTYRDLGLSGRVVAGLPEAAAR